MPVVHGFFAAQNAQSPFSLPHLPPALAADRQVGELIFDWSATDFLHSTKILLAQILSICLFIDMELSEKKKIQRTKTCHDVIRRLRGLGILQETMNEMFVDTEFGEAFIRGKAMLVIVKQKTKPAPIVVQLIKTDDQ